MSFFVNTLIPAKKYKAKLKKIKLVLFDVDGILTDGKVYYAGGEVGFNRFFHILDGYGLKMLKELGYKVGIITGGDSIGVLKRFQLLGITDLYMGNEDKVEAYNDVKKKYNLKDEEILYMADEFFDVPLLRKVGFAVTVPHASIEVRKVCDYVTKRAGGEGAAREMIDILRQSQGKVPEVYNQKI
jgi:3-deoxy-D-manno-octulosonate 8-phosphate phosphatase (KDO 8-P phosphatase)